MYPRYLLALAVLFFISCRNAQKLLDKGNYEKAFYTALADYRKDNRNEKAARIVADAYHASISQIDSTVRRAEKLKPADRFDLQLSALNRGQQLYESLVKISDVPVVGLKDYTEQLAATSNAAAAFRYARGEKFMEKGGKDNALKAYDNFIKAEKLNPDYKDVSTKVTEAYEAALTRIKVNTIDQRFSYFDNLNTAKLSDQVMWELNHIGTARLNKFYTSWDFDRNNDIIPDQQMDIYFYGLHFNPFNISNYSYNVTKDIAETKDGKQVSVTVSATVYVKRYLADASVSMDCHITDFNDRRTVYSNRFYKVYTIDKRTASFTGDSRALTSNDWLLINEKYTQAAKQDIYEELIRRLLSDFTMDMRRLYN